LAKNRYRRIHSHLIEHRRNRVQVLIEEICVDVQRDRRGGVTEQPLHDFDVRASRHRKARGRVPHLMGCQAAQPDRRRGRIEPADPEHLIAQPGAGAGAVEDRLVGGRPLVWRVRSVAKKAGIRIERCS